MKTKNIFLVVGFLSVVLVSVLAAAESTPRPLQRFEKWLTPISDAMNSSDDEKEVSDELISSGGREMSFNLQALGRLYEGQDKDFRELRFAFKEFEDGIGEYNKWVEVRKAAKQSGASPADIKKIEKRVLDARKDLAEMLTTGNWVPNAKDSRLNGIVDFLDSYDWGTDEEDRDVVLTTLESQLKAVQDTEYDFSALEKGDGLHEARREIRWFLIGARVLDGLVIYDKKNPTCPVPDLEGLVNEPIATDKYAGLPASKSEKNPCVISQCLFLSLVDAVNKLGEIKDQAEKENNATGTTVSDKVPTALRKKAESVWQGLEDNGVLGSLRKEIKSCH